jgi:predicted AAA+ superfamily ATPase
LGDGPVVALLGPRQCGKTTLAREFLAPTSSHYFDLEDPAAAALMEHPKMGASWEGFALEETLRAARPDEVYFWAVHSGAELDLLMIKNGRRIGVEFKREDAPRANRSMHPAMADLEFDRLLVVYPRTRSYPIAERIRALPLQHIDQQNQFV